MCLSGRMCPAVRTQRLPTVVVALLIIVLSVFSAGLSAAAPGGRSAAPGPPIGVGPVGTSLIHGDLASTDSTPLRGPGRTARVAASSIPGGACAATFVGSDGLVVSLCTKFIGLRPPQFAVATVVLFDPVTAAPLASKQLTKGGLLGGVYGYLDDRDRVVVADGERTAVHREGKIAALATSGDQVGRVSVGSCHVIFLCDPKMGSRLKSHTRNGFARGLIPKRDRR